MTERKDDMTISVIIGCTRQGRFSEKPAQRILRFSSNFERETLLKLGSSTSATSQCPSSTSPCPSYAWPTALRARRS